MAKMVASPERRGLKVVSYETVDDEKFNELAVFDWIELAGVLVGGAAGLKKTVVQGEMHLNVTGIVSRARICTFQKKTPDGILASQG